MIDVHLADVLNQSLRVLVWIVVPTLLVGLIGLGASLLQGMMGIREEGFQYSVRAVVLFGVLIVFGAGASRALMELMQMALR